MFTAQFSDINYILQDEDESMNGKDYSTSNC